MRDKAGKIAFRRVRDITPEGLEARVATVENINAETRLTALEDAIAVLQGLMTSHTHSYEDDNGTITTVKSTGSAE